MACGRCVSCSLDAPAGRRRTDHLGLWSRCSLGVAQATIIGSPRQCRFHLLGPARREGDAEASPSSVEAPRCATDLWRETSSASWLCGALSLNRVPIMNCQRVIAQVPIVECTDCSKAGVQRYGVELAAIDRLSRARSSEGRERYAA
jgi:hypothetical protein